MLTCHQESYHQVRNFPFPESLAALILLFHKSRDHVVFVLCQSSFKLIESSTEELLTSFPSALFRMIST